jgi:molybdopterin synthase catalytic subunit
MMKIKIVTESFNPWQEIQQFQQSAEDMHGKFGATSIFIGTMRDFNEGDDVKGMTLEHYPGMTEKQLDKIITESMQKWKVIDVLVVHRVGDVFPDDPIVLVAVWSSHRGDAFDTSRYIMEALKSKAPFWKKEILSTDIERWVDKNSDGYL